MNQMARRRPDMNQFDKSMSVDFREDNPEYRLCRTVHYKYLAILVTVASLLLTVAIAYFLWVDEDLLAWGITEVIMTVVIISALIYGLIAGNDVLLMPYIIYATMRAILCLALVVWAVWVVVAPDSGAGRSVRRDIVSGARDYAEGTEQVRIRAVWLLIIFLIGAAIYGLFAFVVYKCYCYYRDKSNRRDAPPPRISIPGI